MWTIVKNLRTGREIIAKHVQKAFNPFYTTLHFYTPLKTSENQGFKTFSEGTEMERWVKMG